MKASVESFVVMPDEEISTALDIAMRASEHYMAQAMMVIGVMATRRSHERSGCSSMVEYLVQAFDKSATWARESIAIGRFLLEHELVAAEFLDGKFTRSHVTVMVRHPEAMSDADFCTTASRLPVARFRDVVAGLCPPKKKKGRQHFVKVTRMPDTGAVAVRALLDPVLGMKVLALLKMSELQAGQSAKVMADVVTCGDLEQAFNQAEQQHDTVTDLLSDPADNDAVDQALAQLTNTADDRLQGDTNSGTDTGDDCGTDTRTGDGADSDAGVVGRLRTRVDRNGRLLSLLCRQTLLASVRTCRVSRFGLPSAANSYAALSFLVDTALSGGGWSSSVRRAPGVRVGVTVREGGAVQAHGCEINRPSLEHLLLNGELVPLVVDSTAPGRMWMGRGARIANDDQIDALMHFYGGKCAMPTCVNRKFIEIHHVGNWSHGGKTDIENLIPLCNWHHAEVTAGRMMIIVPEGHPDKLVFQMTGQHSWVATDRYLPEKCHKPLYVWGRTMHGEMVESEVRPEFAAHAMPQVPVGRKVLVEQGLYLPAALSEPRERAIMGAAVKHALGIDGDTDYGEQCLPETGVAVMTLVKDSTGCFLYDVDIEKEFTTPGGAFCYEVLPPKTRCLISAVRRLRQKRNQPRTTGVRVPLRAHLLYRVPAEKKTPWSGLVSLAAGRAQGRVDATARPVIPETTVLVDGIDKIIAYANNPALPDSTGQISGIYTTEQLLDGSWISACGYACDSDDGTAIGVDDLDPEQMMMPAPPCDPVNILIGSPWRVRPMNGYARHTRAIAHAVLPDPDVTARIGRFPQAMVPSRIFAPTIARNSGFDTDVSWRQLIRLVKLVRLADTIGMVTLTRHKIERLTPEELDIPGLTAHLCDVLCLEIIDHTAVLLAGEPTRTELIEKLSFAGDVFTTHPLHLIDQALHARGHDGIADRLADTLAYYTQPQLPAGNNTDGDNTDGGNGGDTSDESGDKPSGTGDTVDKPDEGGNNN
ncbi:HNH endonuclease signature motif containing protein [Corynebacterium mendelii]|nr:HNH endonuclease signature motif containing protein [Corynebacterium mendelii]